MTNQPESPLTRKIRYILTHAREAWTRNEPNKRKFDILPNGAEIHIQFTAPHELKLALARLGPTPEGPALEKLHTELDTLITYWPELDTLEKDRHARKLIPTDETRRYWLVTTLTIAHQPKLI